MADDGSASIRTTFAYFVHDTTDAAVARRLRMFAAGGARTTLIGFRRRGGARTRIGDTPVVDLGLTGDDRLIRRAMSVLGVLLRPGKVRAALGDGDTIVARNLETLVIARALGGKRRIVFECLDIHRLMAGEGAASRLLRAVERWALRGVAVLAISSPRFLSEHFARRYSRLPDVLIVENRLLTLDPQPSPLPAPERQAPWTIGWFGMLRCATTLALLKDIVAHAAGRVRVLIAGIPTPAVFDDFAGQVARLPGFEFVGPYSSADLPNLYARVDFAWTIDYFEQGLNSTWLLPNRLYESLAHGAVPVALAGTETAAWLARNGVGVVVVDPEQDLSNMLQSLTTDAFGAMKRAVVALPPSLTRAGPEDCRDLVRQWAGR